MSAAPSPAARPPPHPGTIPQHNSLLGAPISPSVPRASRSSSSPLRGCGRSTWTRSSTASPTSLRPEGQRTIRETLAPGPVFIERLRMRLAKIIDGRTHLIAQGRTAVELDQRHLADHC